VKHSGVDAGVYLIATRSRDKVREIREIVAARPRISLLGLDEAGLTPGEEEEGVEIHETFIGNALAKASYFLRRSGLPAIADDSGLCVDALGGAPGVRSRRFASGETARGLSADEANNALLLHRLADIPAERRTARYVCAAAVAYPDGDVVIAIGSVVGRIGFTARGHGGFGYDPLFELEPGKTFAELDSSEKHRLSHRGRAFRALLAQLDPRRRQD
jgi:XTP/dITP diphosphohydrolase